MNTYQSQQFWDSISSIIGFTTSIVVMSFVVGMVKPFGSEEPKRIWLVYITKEGKWGAWDISPAKPTLSIHKEDPKKYLKEWAEYYYLDAEAQVERGRFAKYWISEATTRHRAIRNVQVVALPEYHSSPQYDKYIEVRARELSAKTGEPFEEVLEVLKRPTEAPHYRVLGWIVREEPGTETAEFGLATGITVEPGLPEILRRVYIAHEIGHGESVCKKLQRGEQISIGKEFECLAWQEGMPAARELDVLKEYFNLWCKEADYLGCYPPDGVRKSIK